MRRRALDCRSGGEVVLHTDVVTVKKYLYVTMISMGVGRIGGGMETGTMFCTSVVASYYSDLCD